MSEYTDDEKVVLKKIRKGEFLLEKDHKKLGAIIIKQNQELERLEKIDKEDKKIIKELINKNRELQKMLIKITQNR